MPSNHLRPGHGLINSFTDPVNYRLLHPRLAIFLVSKQVHEEAYPVFYSQPIRLFPTHGRFFYKQPLLARLSTRYRSAITTLELRLGPGWSAPPKSQNTDPPLGLEDCTSLRTLKVFVECDPSDNIFNGFRGTGATQDTYKNFCTNLVAGILAQVPSLETIELDAYPGVKKEAPLVMALRRKVEESDTQLVWGPLRGCTSNQLVRGSSATRPVFRQLRPPSRPSRPSHSLRNHADHAFREQSLRRTRPHRPRASPSRHGHLRHRTQDDRSSSLVRPSFPVGVGGYARKSVPGEFRR